MGCVSLVLGFMSLSGSLIGLFINFLNCFNIPAALLGLILALVDLARPRMPDEGRGSATAGLILNGLALLIGTSRFLVGLTIGGL
jgi:hypothetical protein